MDSGNKARKTAYLGIVTLLLVGLSISFLLTGCGEKEASETAAAPTRTPRPTFTIYPTLTPVPEMTATPLPPTPTVVPSPTLDANLNPLTGEQVEDPALVQRRVLAVRVGNDPEIRPQEGLGQAEIVYEEIMEGWTVTRFTALYLAADAERIRPIRSARLVSLDIAPQYDAALAHSGASDEIRWRISQADFVDLDEFFNPGPYGILPEYDWRGRMYTSVEALRDYLTANDLEANEHIRGYAFDPQPPEGEAAQSIEIPYPRLCAVTWDYDEATEAYLRSVQGEAHLDGLTDEQITAENVVILYAPHEKTDIVEDSLGNTAIDIALQETTGPAQVCRDGVCVAGNWQHEQPEELIRYYDDQGKEIALKPGTTWIELVPLDYEISLDGTAI